jgi:hypothetical protein
VLIFLNFGGGCPCLRVEGRGAGGSNFVAGVGSLQKQFRQNKTKFIALRLGATGALILKRLERLECLEKHRTSNPFAISGRALNVEPATALEGLEPGRGWRARPGTISPLRWEVGSLGNRGRKREKGCIEDDGYNEKEIASQKKSGVAEQFGGQRHQRLFAPEP